MDNFEKLKAFWKENDNKVSGMKLKKFLNDLSVIFHKNIFNNVYKFIFSFLMLFY